MDWHGVQRHFSVSGKEGTVVVATPDIPLVQVNGINTRLWREFLPAHNGTVMAWVMNNYWNTNFPAGQGGLMKYRYSLCFTPGKFNADAAGAFASSIRQPLLASLSVV